VVASQLPDAFAAQCRATERGRLRQSRNGRDGKHRRKTSTSDKIVKICTSNKASSDRHSACALQVSTCVAVMARTSLCSAALGTLCLLVVFHSIAVAERHFPTKGGSLLSAESVRSGSKHGDVSDELADAPGNGDGTYITSLDPDELDFQQDMPPGDAVKPLHDSEALAARAHVSPNAEMHVLSMEHRVFYYPNFLTDEEADHIRELAEPNLVRSKVIDSKTGISRDDSVRTSQSSSLRRSHDEVVAAVDQRIKKWTLMPANHGEGLNVLRCQHGQKYSGVSSSNLCLPWGLAARK